MCLFSVCKGYNVFTVAFDLRRTTKLTPFKRQHAGIKCSLRNLVTYSLSSANVGLLLCVFFISFIRLFVCFLFACLLAYLKWNTHNTVGVVRMESLSLIDPIKRFGRVTTFLY